MKHRLWICACLGLVAALPARAQAPTLAVEGGGRVTEGNAGVTQVGFTIVRSGDTASPINFGLRTVPGAANPAEDGVDYLGIGGTRYVMGAGETELQVEISIVGDALAELDERLSLWVESAHLPGGITMIDTDPPHAVATDPSAMAIRDLDADGAPEIITSHYEGGVIGVLRNLSVPGAVAFAAPATFPSGVDGWPMAIGDVDGDGLDDVLLTTGTNNVTVRRHAANPKLIAFEAPQLVPVDMGQSSIALGDVTGDGRPDLIVGNGNTAVIKVLRNTSMAGVPAFADGVTLQFGTGPRYIVVRDMDGDGKSDLVVNDDLLSGAWVVRNTGTAGSIAFAEPQLFPTNYGTYTIHAADLDGDGLADIAGAYMGLSAVAVLRNTSMPGSLSFAGYQEFAIGSDFASTAVGDVDGDGKADIVASNRGDDSVSVLRNVSIAGTIDFADQVVYGTGGANVLWPEIGDIDGDGQSDIAVTNEGDKLAVIRNDRPAVAATSAATVLIANDDEPMVAFEAAGASLAESNGSIMVTVTLLGVSADTVTVEYVLGGTATPGVDYTVTPDVLTFAPGQVSQALTINGLADSAADAASSETIVIDLQDPSNATLGAPSVHTLTIASDSAPPVEEGTGGSGGSLGPGVLLLLGLALLRGAHRGGGRPTRGAPRRASATGRGAAHRAAAGPACAAPR